MGNKLIKILLNGALVVIPWAWFNIANTISTIL